MKTIISIPFSNTAKRNHSRITNKHANWIYQFHESLQQLAWHWPQLKQPLQGQHRLCPTLIFPPLWCTSSGSNAGKSYLSQRGIQRSDCPGHLTSILNRKSQKSFSKNHKSQGMLDLSITFIHLYKSYRADGIMNFVSFARLQRRAYSELNLNTGQLGIDDHAHIHPGINKIHVFLLTIWKICSNNDIKKAWYAHKRIQQILIEETKCFFPADQIGSLSCESRNFFSFSLLFSRLQLKPAIIATRYVSHLKLAEPKYKNIIGKIMIIITCLCDLVYAWAPPQRFSWVKIWTLFWPLQHLDSFLSILKSLCWHAPDYCPALWHLTLENFGKLHHSTLSRSFGSK